MVFVHNYAYLVQEKLNIWGGTFNYANNYHGLLVIKYVVNPFHEQNLECLKNLNLYLSDKDNKLAISWCVRSLFLKVCGYESI